MNPLNISINKLLIILSAIVCCTFFSCARKSIKNQKLKVNSDISYVPIQEISLEPYKSVQLREGQNPKLALGVSIAGGGSRAQFFSTGVLIGLDEIKKNNQGVSFLNEVDYFSTVSGGGFGVGYYFVLKSKGVLNGYKNYFEFWKSKNHKEYYRENLTKKAIPTNILFKFPLYERNRIKTTYPTLINFQLLQRLRKIRSVDGTEVKGTSIQEMKLIEFFIPKGDKARTVKLPMFVANGAIYTNGDRLPFMPHILENLKIERSLLPERTFDSANGYDMPLQYPISGSAAFPGVLPMLKLQVKGKKDSVIRVIDGGVIDNLGVNSLHELLVADDFSNISKKSALIINCSGSGLESYFIPNSKLKIFDFVQQSALYSVQTNQLNSFKSTSKKFKADKIEHLEIGFHTIKKFLTDYKDSNNDVQLKIQTLKKNFSSDGGSWKWIRLYEHFTKIMAIKSSELLSEISISDFSKFTTEQIFCLFELSSQVETKLSIDEREKQVLVLAGRYAVYLKQKEIEELMDTNN